MSLTKKIARKAKKNGDLSNSRTHITLSNPVANQFASFIFGNVAYYQKTFNRHPPVVEQDSALGQRLVLCGAGPSLKTHAKDYCVPGVQVWGCNSAVTWLYEQRHHVTHGYTVDQTPQMVTEWASAPPVEYLIASTAHPHLVEHLVAKQRSFTFFHSFVGIKEKPVAYAVCPDCVGTLDTGMAACPQCGRSDLIRQQLEYEDWLYAALYPPTVRTGSGLNAVTRAIDVALFMGFDPIVVLGADCALQVSRPLPNGATVGTPEHKKWLDESVVMHANGDSPTASGATAMTMDGEICPRCECGKRRCRHCDGTCECPERKRWYSKPDMMVTAQFLAKMKQRLGDRLQLIGDILPNALVGKPDSYFDRLPSLLGQDGKPVRPT